MRYAPRYLLVSVVLSILAPAAQAGPEVYRAMGLNKDRILSITQLSGKVMPGGDKQFVCLATYLTGKREKDDAVGVKLSVLSSVDLEPLYETDYAIKHGALVGDGNLEVFDLDRDGLSEIIVSFDSYADPLVEQRLGEVIVWDESDEQRGFRVGWEGQMEYDATRAVRTVSGDRRDRFTREIDLVNTLRTRGVTLFFRKTMIAVAGERLPEPKIVEETFPLRTRPSFR